MRRSTAPVFTAALGMLLAACASAPVTRMHSLLVAPPSPAALPAQSVSSGVAWELVGVSVPAQVDTPQFVLRLPDGTLTQLEHERWASPLTDELRAALGQRLAQVSVPATSSTGWQLTVELRRFDALLGTRVVLEADWSIRSAQSHGARLRCHGVFEQPAPGGVDAVAAGHRATVARLGDAMAAGLAALATGMTPGCAAAGGS